MMGVTVSLLRSEGCVGIQPDLMIYQGALRKFHFPITATGSLLFWEFIGIKWREQSKVSVHRLERVCIRATCNVAQDCAH